MRNHGRRMPWPASPPSSPASPSCRITQLQPDFFWIGAGEVDLKLGLHAAEFVRKYQPIVADCTYD